MSYPSLFHPSGAQRLFPPSPPWDSTIVHSALLAMSTFHYTTTISPDSMPLLSSALLLSPSISLVPPFFSWPIQLIGDVLWSLLSYSYFFWIYNWHICTSPASSHPPQSQFMLMYSFVLPQPMPRGKFPLSAKILFLWSALPIINGSIAFLSILLCLPPWGKETFYQAIHWSGRDFAYWDFLVWTQCDNV